MRGRDGAVIATAAYLLVGALLDEVVTHKPTISIAAVSASAPPCLTVPTPPRVKQPREPVIRLEPDQRTIA